MSKYTTEVRYIVEEWYNTHHQLPTPPTNAEAFWNIQEMCSQTATDWNFVFPIWEGETCSGLLSCILQHYYFREIGFETAQLWKLMLWRRLRETMPKYVEIYKTTTQEFDMIGNVNVTETFTSDKTENTTDKGTQTMDSEGNVGVTITDNTTIINSDLPQTTLTLQDANKDYATNSSQTTYKSKNDNIHSDSSSLSSSNTSDRTNNENYTRTRKGIDGGKSQTELLLEYRNSIISVYQMVMEEVSDLFMLIY